jgi:CRISPR-associated protein Cas1
MQLVINSYGASLHRLGELFQIKVDGRDVKVAAQKVRSLLITTGAHFSSDTIQLALEHNIDVIILDKFGHPSGRFWPAKMGSTAAIRRRQIQVAESPESLEVIRAWTGAKLQNQADFLEQLARRRPPRAAEFADAVSEIRAENERLTGLTGSVEELRNQILMLEGRAAASYWQLMGTLPPTPFQFKSRTKHPARDSYNAMLNYAYGVLYSHVDRACIIAGLDPFVGFLHTDNYNKRSLVFDLIEPFRIWADRIVTKLFTGRRCHETMFSSSRDGITLEKEAKALLLGELNTYLDEAIHYQLKSGRKGKTHQIKRRACIQAEAHTLANRLLGKEGGLPQVMETKEIFAGDDDAE